MENGRTWSSYDIIEEAVTKYWQKSAPQDVIVFFYQKYAHDSGWDFCQELVMANSSFDYESMTFLNDFCEGQTDVKDIIIIPLKDVTLYYAEHALNK